MANSSLPNETAMQLYYRTVLSHRNFVYKNGNELKVLSFQSHLLF